MVQHVTVYRDVKPVKLASIGDAQLMGEYADNWSGKVGLFTLQVAV